MAVEAHNTKQRRVLLAHLSLLHLPLYTVPLWHPQRSTATEIHCQCNEHRQKNLATAADDVMASAGDSAIIYADAADGSLFIMLSASFQGIIYYICRYAARDMVNVTVCVPATSAGDKHFPPPSHLSPSPPPPPTPTASPLAGPPFLRPCPRSPPAAEGPSLARSSRGAAVVGVHRRSRVGRKEGRGRGGTERRGAALTRPAAP